MKGFPTAEIILRGRNGVSEESRRIDASRRERKPNPSAVVWKKRRENVRKCEKGETESEAGHTIAPRAACFLKAEVASGRKEDVTLPSRERPYAATLEAKERQFSNRFSA